MVGDVCGKHLKDVQIKKKKKNSSSVALILYSYFKEMGYFEIIAWLTFYVSNFIIIMCNNVQVNL